jgi:predicted ATPase
MRELPTGTVTFLFTDIEGSTRLLHELGDDYPEALAEHRRRLREAFAQHGGVEVDTQGDAFFAAFSEASGALAAAGQAQAALAEGPIRVRMGIHSGEPLLTEEGYVGIDVHRGARVMSAGHGGQLLVSEATHSLLERTSALADLGRHRLKDLTEPQTLYQLGTQEFPPLKTLYQTNLPIQPTPLVGRGQELAEVLALIAAARLVTLTGSGGSGKTRLALQVAAELVDDYPQGVWWISLAALRDPQLVEPTIAEVVGAKGDLGEHVREQKALLLLDNFEQLVDASPGIAALLAEAPELRILVTSRERLAIAAEHEYEVPSLVPAEALALFTARARQLNPAFEPDEDVGEICARLDGLPLALELAAARTKVLGPAHILERLGKSLELLTAADRDAPERQQTLRATIEWSYDLLTEDEQHLFACLAVFAASFALDVAEQVCEATIDGLQALMDKSLLRRSGDRYWMLETIREFAAERLEYLNESANVRSRQVDYYLALAESADAAYMRADEFHELLDELALEHDNVRATLAWLAERREGEHLAHFVAALWRFWYHRGYLREAASWLEPALASADLAAPLRAQFLGAAGALKAVTGDPARGRVLSEQSLELYEALADPAGIAEELNNVGLTVYALGDVEESQRLLHRCASLARESGDRYHLALACTNLADQAAAAGRFGESQRLAEEAIDAARTIGNRWLLATGLVSWGQATVEAEDYDAAVPALQEGIAIAAAIKVPDVVRWGVVAMAAVAAHGGDAMRAAVLLAVNDALFEHLGTIYPDWRHGAFARAIVESSLREEERLEATAIGQEMTLEQAATYCSGISTAGES